MQKLFVPIKPCMYVQVALNANKYHYAHIIHINSTSNKYIAL